jgi:UDP-glucose 6-dehydrogenase
MKIVILGYGWVGQANALSLKIMGEDVYFYDPLRPEAHYKDEYAEVYEQIKPLSSPLEIDGPDTAYIICVGDKVSDTGEQDVINIEKALSSLDGSVGTVILRSTILPDYLKRLGFHFYIPEFLHEKKAVVECAAPHYFVIGSRNQKPEPDFVKKWRAKSYKVFEGTPEEASYIKYLSNIWNSVRIAFINEFGNAIKVPKNSEDIKSIERVIDFIFGGKSYLRYGRGFGGHCLPKDTRAFANYISRSGLTPHILKGVLDSNDAHLEMYKQNNLLTEWFSEWERPQISGRVAISSLGKILSRRISKL